MSNTRMITIIIIIACICSGLTAPTDCGTVRYTYILKNHRSYRIKFNIPPTGQLMATYNIKFRYSDSLIPVAIFDIDKTHPKYNSWCWTNIQTMGLNNGYAITLRKGTPSSQCERMGDWLVCSGTKRYNTVTDSDWWLEIAFQCGFTAIVDFIVHVELKCSFPITCEEMKNEECKRHVNYNLTSLPNALGLTSHTEINYLTSIALLIFESNYVCYQHIMEFMCYSLFPMCQQDKAIMPCRQMCTDCVTGCSEMLRIYKQDLYCSYLPHSLDPKICYYKPIICPTPEPPKAGWVVSMGREVHNITTYSCDDGFELTGDPQRHCLYNGTWNGTRPVCINKTSLITGLSISGVIAILIVLAVILGVCFKTELNLLHNHRRSHVADGSVQRKLFVSFCTENRDVVENFLQAIKVELPGFEITTFDDCFDGGQNLIACMDKAVWESESTIVLLTRAYAQSGYCRHEFLQCQTRAATDQKFRFITVMFEEFDDFVDDLDGVMKHVIKQRIYLKYGELLFWNQLRRGLKVGIDLVIK